MAQILVRRIDEATVARLKESARRSGRSLEEECRVVLDEASRRQSISALLARWGAEDEGLEQEADPFAGVRMRGDLRAPDLE